MISMAVFRMQTNALSPFLGSSMVERSAANRELQIT
jgi:hypothetical protein